MRRVLGAGRKFQPRGYVNEIRDPVAPRAPTALIAEQVERLLRANLYRQAPLAEILAPLPIGRRQLARIFRDQRGTTIKRAQLALKIAEARTLLRNPQFSVTGVAFDLGFPSSQHFATAFKALIGAPPGVWRVSAGRDAPATPVDDR